MTWAPNETELEWPVFTGTGQGRRRRRRRSCRRCPSGGLPGLRACRSEAARVAADIGVVLADSAVRNAGADAGGDPPFAKPAGGISGHLGPNKPS